MKKRISKLLVFSIVIVFAAGVVLYSCSKNNESITPITTAGQNYDQNTGSIDDQILFYYYEYQKQNQGNRSVFKKIWKWIKAHSGVTMFGDCGLDLPCGQCPGMCLAVPNNWIPVDDDYIMSQQEYDAGLRLFQVAYYNDSILEINFIHSDLVYHDTCFISRRYNIGSDISSIYEKDSIVLRQGAYPVSYAYSANGTTLVKVDSY